ncbi:MAG: SpoIIE family protein phosphatase [Candidatus Gracilibacteria bacterium]|jgi:serine phosphatase RsbU (regulator of sigma subunit)
MFRSLKAKFVLAFGSLIVVLFTALGLFLVEAKTRELAEGISDNSQSFAVFTAEPLVSAYRDLLQPGNFIQFTRQVDYTLRHAEEISDISIAGYSGSLLYDSKGEHQERYSGEPRVLDEKTLERVQGGKTSLLLEDGQVVYLKVDSDKHISFVDFNEDSVEPPSSTARITNIVVPTNNAFAVIYQVSYEAMEASLFAAKIQIGVIAGLGFILTLMISFMLSVSITRPLKELKAGALKIAAGDFSARVLVRTRDEVGVLAGTFNQMAEDLAASLEAKIYKERVAKELELAAKIQVDLLPKTQLELPSLEVVGGLVPATEVGGDAYDFIPMEDGNTLIYIGDGTGHGVPAGIMASISNALLYSLRAEPDLMVIADRLNAVIQKKSSNTMFITMGLTVWDEQSSTLRYLNAGHLPMLHFDAEAQSLNEIKLQGMAFGMVDEVTAHLEQRDIPLKKDDLIVLYSDGIPDAQNENGESYGVARLKAAMESAKEGSAEHIKDAILAAVMQFIGTREHLDDITVVVMKKK